MPGPGARGGEGDVDEAALDLREGTSRQRRWAVIGLGVVAGDADRGVEGIVVEDPEDKGLRRARGSDLAIAEAEARLVGEINTPPDLLESESTASLAAGSTTG